jgi:hypothetical protein
VRASGHEVEVVPAAGDLVGGVMASVRDLLGSGIVGVIVPPSARAGLVAGLDAEGIAWSPELLPAAAPVVVLTPDDAKGLEFDVVVVVEPAAIVAESEHGLRSLYVALTRCTSRLALVHARPLPEVLGLGGTAAPEAEAAPQVAEEPEPGSEPEAVVQIEPEAEPDAEPEHEAAAEPGHSIEAEPSVVLGLATDADPDPDGEPALVDTVVVSTPVPDLAATLDALGGLDRDIARAVAGAVVERLRALLAPPLLAQVAGEIARTLAPPPADDPGDHDQPELADTPAEPADAPAEPDEAVVHPVPPGQR